jgi:hypothetical protein
LVVLGLAVVTLFGMPRDAARADAKLDVGNLKDLLPEAELSRVVDESAKVLQDYTKSAGNLNLNAKKVENEAYSLIVYAEVVRRGGSGDGGKKAALLQQAAQQLAEAAKKKDLKAAQEQVKAITGFKSLKPGGDVDMADVDLSQAVPRHNLMEQVNAINKKMTEYRRMNAAAFQVKGKPDEVVINAHKMAALSVAITAHAPDKDLPAGKTKQDWLKATEDMRKATLEIAAAAKAKKQADMKSAINRMDTACTKCHDDFRVEIK